MQNKFGGNEGRRIRLCGREQDTPRTARSKASRESITRSPSVQTPSVRTEQNLLFLLPVNQNEGVHLGSVRANVGKISADCFNESEETGSLVGLTGQGEPRLCDLWRPLAVEAVKCS